MLAAKVTRAVAALAMLLALQLALATVTFGRASGVAPYRLSGTVSLTYTSQQILAGECSSRRGTISTTETVRMRWSRRKAYVTKEDLGPGSVRHRWELIRGYRVRNYYGGKVRTPLFGGVRGVGTYTAQGTSSEETNTAYCVEPPSWQPYNRPDPTACGTVPLRTGVTAIYLIGLRESGVTLGLPLPDVPRKLKGLTRCRFAPDGQDGYAPDMATFVNRVKPAPSTRSVRRMLSSGARIRLARSYSRALPTGPGTGLSGGRETLQVRVNLVLRRIGRWRL